MGMMFFIRTKEEFYGRMVMGEMGRHAATLFFDIANLIEERLEHPCGLIDDSDRDEYGVNPTEFIKFFEQFMSYVWTGERIEYLYNWAEYAAGMIEIITLEPRMWKHRHGQALRPIRYARLNEAAQAEFDKKAEPIVKSQKYPKESHPDYNRLTYEDYVEIIENACLKT